MATGRLKHLPLILTVVLLGGIVAHSATRPKASDAEPYHRRVKASFGGLPKAFGGWTSTDEQPSKAAMALLRDPQMLQRRFLDKERNLAATFLVVACKDAADLGGHYPPNCYPGQGFVRVETLDLDWDVGGRTIPGRQYQFRKTQGMEHLTLFVDSLLFAPGVGFVRDIDEIRRAAGDYRRQHYGAAQIQVVTTDAMTRKQREQIFQDIIGANLAVIDALRSEGKP
jgi:hypothetical protein